jgi:fluoride ion exporter CrcB/FEX
MIRLAIDVGGGVGALARHGVNRLLQGRAGTEMPLGILAAGSWRA